MVADLSGKRIAFPMAQEGVEEVELTKPWEAAERAGAKPELTPPEAGEHPVSAAGVTASSNSRRG
jgi:deglycase